MPLRPYPIRFVRIYILIIFAVFFSFGVAFLAANVLKVNAAAVGSSASFTGGNSGGFSNNDIVTDGTSVWVANNDGTVTKWARYGGTTLISTSTMGVTADTILFAGGNIWVAGSATGTNFDVVELSPSGTLLKTVGIGTNIYPRSLAYDGSNIWVGGGNNSNKLEEVSSAGSLIFSTSTAFANTWGMAFDGTNLWLNGDLGYVARYSTSGTLVATTSLPTSGLANNEGMLFDGTNLWAQYASYPSGNPGGLEKISTSGTILANYSITQAGLSLAFDGTNVWASNAANVYDITPSGTVTQYSGGGYGAAYVSSSKALWTATGRFGGVTIFETTSTQPSDSTLSALSVASGTVNPALSSSTTSYILKVPDGATSIALTATTTDPQAGVWVLNQQMTNGSPTTITGLSDGSTFNLFVYAQDYSHTLDGMDIAWTPSADSTLTFQSTVGTVNCPNTAPVDCTLTATSTQATTTFDFTPTLAVPGGSMTINSSTWTSGQKYTATAPTGNIVGYAIHVTGADSSTSTYNISIKTTFPNLVSTYQYTTSSINSFNESLTTDGTNAWVGGSNGGLTEVTPSGTTVFYNGPDTCGSNGAVFDGTNFWTVDFCNDIKKFTTGSHVWTKYTPPATGFSNFQDGMFGVTIDSNKNLWGVNWDNGNAIEVSPTGTFFGNYPSSTPSNIFQEVQDSIAYDGINMWAADSASGTVTEFDPSGNVLRKVNLGTGSNPFGIAFDGTNIWTANAGSSTVSEISSTGTIMNSYVTPVNAGNPNSIAFDGVNIWVGYSGPYVSSITTNGTIKTYTLPPFSFDSIALAYASTTGMMWAEGNGSSQGVVEFSVNQGGSPPTYTVTVTQSLNGTISPGTQTGIASGASESFTITPNAGYAVSGLTVDGASVSTSTSYIFSNITANHTITASFSAVSSGGGGGNTTPVITVDVGGGGTPIIPNASTTTSSTSSSTPSSTYASTPSSTPVTIPAFTPPPVPPLPTKTISGKTAFLFVVENVINGYGDAKIPSNFTISVNSAGKGRASLFGNASGTLISVKPGSYSISQKAVTGYAVDRSSDCTGVAVSGAAMVCVITTAQLPPPSLVVTENVINSYFGTQTAADFTASVNGVGVSPKSFLGDAAGTSISLAPGRYRVSEKSIAGYKIVFSSGCSGAAAYGVVSNCTITASDPVMAHIIVNEDVINNYGGTKFAPNFSVYIKGVKPVPSSFVGNASGTLVVLSPGAYSVSQRTVTGYAVTLSSGCAGNIIAGETVRCDVIANDLAPESLLITENVVNSYGGVALPSDFTVSVSAKSPSLGSFVGNASGTSITIQPGGYSVTQRAPVGYVVAFSSGCKGIATYGGANVCLVTETQKMPKGYVAPTPAPTPTSTPISTPISTSTPAAVATTTPTSTVSSSSFGSSSTQTPPIVMPITPSTTITINTGGVVVTSTNITISLNPPFASGTIVTSNEGRADMTPPTPVPIAPYPWTLTPGQGIKTVSVAYTPPGSTVPTATTSRSVFLDLGQNIIFTPTVVCDDMLYLKGYAFSNYDNDSQTVIKIQRFLNTFFGADLSVNGIYDTSTQASVDQFQLEYKDEVLKPWVAYGLPSVSTPTGQTYKTTQRWINILSCPGLNLPIPSLP